MRITGHVSQESYIGGFTDGPHLARDQLLSSHVEQRNSS